MNGPGWPAFEQLGVVEDDFTALVEPHLPTLTWWAACLRPGRHEDLVQQAVTRAWHRRSRFDQDSTHARALLCSVVADRSRRLDRGRSSEEPSELVVPVPGAADGVDVRRALELLAEPQRRAVDCHHLVGLTLADTALVLGRPVEEVEVALLDARRTLRRELAGPAGARSGAVAAMQSASGVHDADQEDAADRWIAALLLAAGTQFRAAIPAVTFEEPSSRMSMLSRRARLALIGGIAAAVLGVVVAGVGIVRPAATPVTSLAAITPLAGVPDSSPGSQRPSAAAESSSVAAPVDVGPAASPRGSRPAWPSTGLISAFPSAAGAAGGVRVAWEVATGDLLVGIPETLLCNDRQIRLRLDSTTALHLDLYGGVGPDQQCTGDSLRVVAFAPLAGQNDGQSVVRVTGSTGTLLLPGLSGLELDRSGTGAGLPSVSGVRTVGHSPDVDVHWQPETGRLLVSARGCGAFATADLGNGTEVTVVIRPTDELCPGLPETAIHVIQIPPQPPGSPFQVVVFNSTRDRSGTTDVFTFPATSLRASPTSSVEPAKLVRVETRHQKLLGIDRIGRSADNKLHLEVSLPPGTTEVLVPSATLLADQSIAIAQDGAAGSFGNDSSRPVTMVYQLDIPPVSDVHRPLLIRIGDEELVLPAL